MDCNQGTKNMKHALYKLIFILLISLSSHTSYAALINDIPTETVRERITLGAYGWQASYDISFTNQDLLIDVDVFLTGFDAGQALKDIWEDGIESIWSNEFDLFDGTYYYDTVFNVDWLDSSTGADHTVFVHEGNGSVNLANWYTGNPSGWGYNNQGRVAAHEFGHMIGLLDEYAGGATQIIRDDSIMGRRLSTPQEDHFTDFTSWLSINSGISSLSLVSDSGSHNYIIDVPEPVVFILFVFALAFLLIKRRRSNTRYLQPLSA